MTTNQRTTQHEIELSSTSKPSNNCLPIPKRAAMNLEFSNITFSVPTGNKKEVKTILKGISGRFASGQLIGIVGPSGAGKSTLLNILSGYRKSKVTGEIRVNGEKRDPRSFRMESCYIMQEDYILKYLSVQELMESTATLKLGTGISRMEKKVIISDILDSLSLTQCHSTRVCNLSGGEKKRLSIAFELINNPPLMFFDEPTSGLDSQNSQICINLLKRLSQDGRTIVCTIHQPSARMLQMFDHIYAIADGHCIYRGSVVELLPYLSSFGLECPPYCNPADFLLEIASGEYGTASTQLADAAKDEWEKKSSLKITEGEPGETSLLITENGNANLYPVRKGDSKLETTSCVIDSLANSSDLQIPYAASFFVQFSVLVRRTFLSIMRDTIQTKLRIVMHIVIGLTMGLLYFKLGNDAKYVFSNIGLLLICIMLHVFMSMMTTVMTFSRPTRDTEEVPLEMNVFRKEHQNHWYSLKAYYFAKTLADIPFQMANTIVFILIAYFMTAQPFEIERLCYYMLLSILISLVAQSIGLSIGAILHVEPAVLLGSISIMPPLMFGGFFLTFSATPVYLKWLTYVSYIRYAYEGSMLIIYGMNREKLDCSDAFCLFKYPQKILEFTEMEDSSLWFDFLMLFVWFIAMRVLVYFVLRYKLKQES